MLVRIILLFVWLIVIFGFDYWNWYIIEVAKKNVRHALQLFYRILVAAGLTYVSFLISKSLFDMFVYMAYEFSTFALLFNILLNAERRKAIFYLGEGNNTDKILKWFFDRTAPEFYYWCILVLSTLFSYAYIIGKDEFFSLMGW